MFTEIDYSIPRNNSLVCTDMYEPSVEQRIVARANKLHTILVILNLYDMSAAHVQVYFVKNRF